MYVKAYKKSETESLPDGVSTSTYLQVNFVKNVGDVKVGDHLKFQVKTSVSVGVTVVAYRTIFYAGQIGTAEKRKRNLLIRSMLFMSTSPSNVETIGKAVTSSGTNTSWNYKTISMNMTVGSGGSAANALIYDSATTLGKYLCGGSFLEEDTTYLKAIYLPNFLVSYTNSSSINPTDGFVLKAIYLPRELVIKYVQLA